MVPPTDPPAVSPAAPAGLPSPSEMAGGSGSPGPIVVQKYGGSSVADVERIRAVARRVVAGVAAGQRVVVV